MAKKSVINEELFMDVLDDVAHIEELKAALQDKIQSRKAEIIAQLKTVISTFGLTTKDLFDKEDITAAATRVQAQSTSEPRKPKDVYFNQELNDIYYGGPKKPQWLKDAEAAKSEDTFKVAGKESGALLRKFGKIEAAERYEAFYNNETEPNPAV